MAAEPKPESPGDAAVCDAASLKQRLSARARALGFQRMGVARAEPLREEGAQLRRWLAAGHHGEMAYMADTAEVRADVRHPGMLPGARSVVVLATAYARGEPQQGPAPGKVARYAQGRDYHNVLGKRLQKLAGFLRAQGHATRAGSDTLPILERAWAARAGLGFIGKNCCLIVPGLGSHVFLSALVTRAELAPDPPMKPRCGACRACLDACPTAAFVGPHQLDARRCISYLTIEQRGAIPQDLRSGLGEWLFGCDVCQDVCPFNRTKPVDPEQSAPFRADARWQAHTAEALLGLDQSQFAAYARGSALSRPGREGIARNAAVVLGNRGGPVHLRVLQETARRHPSAVVREAAAWASSRIGERTDRGYRGSDTLPSPPPSVTGQSASGSPVTGSSEQSGPVQSRG